MTRSSYRSVFGTLTGAILLLVAISSAGNTPNESRRTAISNQYIVQFKGQPTRAEILTLVREMTIQNKVRLRHTYKHAVFGFSGDISSDQVAELQKHPMVASVEKGQIWYVGTLDAPTDLVANAPNDTQVDLTWTDNATTENGFQVLRSDTGIGGTYSVIASLRTPNLSAYSDTGLTPGIEVCYQVRAAASFSSVGPESESACATPGGAVTPPAAPDNAVASTVSDSEIDVTWNDLSADEDEFKIERALGAGGAFVEVATVGPGITFYPDIGLAAETEYCYRVLASNSAGDSGPSNESCATTDAAPSNPPAPPTNLVTTTFSESRIDLSYTDNSGDETGFRVERAIGTGGAFSEIDILGADVTTYEDTNLAADTEYCYRVLAYNVAGDSDYTNESCATTDASTDPFAAPTNLVAIAPDEFQIDLTWNDNATAETGFEVHRSTTGIGGTYTVLQQLPGANQNSYTDSAVTEGVEHCYMVRAMQSRTVPGPFSAPACATPTGAPEVIPDAPTNLALNVVGSSRIDLDYTDNANNESGFRIERGDVLAGPFTEIDIVGTDVTSYSDTGLPAQTQQCYRVRAYNGAGDSAYTNAACATTEAPSACTDTGGHDDLTETWGIDIVEADLNSTWQASTTAGCEIDPWFFGIDTGIDSDHPDLNVIETMDFTGIGNGGEDDHGHGTHTAGTVAAIDGNGGVVGVAPGAPTHGFKVCDAAGSCLTVDIVAGSTKLQLARTQTRIRPWSPT